MYNVKNEILNIKNTKNIIILAHNYVSDEIHDIADFCGDTLEISKKTLDLNCDTVIVCGVNFMAETVKILSPQKQVLMPVKDAICPMVNMINISDLNRIKEEHDNAIVICYVNSNLETKMNSDICCTSSNAELIVNSIPTDKEIIFIPDKNLGKNIANKTNRSNIITLNGYCPVHVEITPDMIINKKMQYPDALVLVHPECTPDVIKLADVVTSTGKMVNIIKKINNKQIIIVTEPGIVYRLKNENPDKQIIPISENNICSNIKKISTLSILDSLNNLQYEVKINDDILDKVKKPVMNMLKY